MEILYLILVFFLCISKNTVCCQYTPSIAIHDNLPPMYKTDKGWVLKDKFLDRSWNATDIVNLCKQIYPNYDIINAAHVFQKEVITNWCRSNQSCTAKDSYSIHPIVCINSSYTYKPMSIPSYCKFDTSQKKGCTIFYEWKLETQSNCNENYQILHDMQVIFPCKDQYMVFGEVEYICCSNKDEVTDYSPNLWTKLNAIIKKYRPILDQYQYGKSLHSERKLFSRTKHALEDSYKKSLEFLQTETIDTLKGIIKKIGVAIGKPYNDAEENLYLTFKHNYAAITSKFKRELFHLDSIHIRRIIKRTDNICHLKNNTDTDLLHCSHEISNVTKRIMRHYNRMMHLRGIDRQEYLAFIQSRLRHFHSKYLPLMHDNTVLAKRFSGQLEKYRLEMESSQKYDSKWLDYIIKQTFLKCKEKATYLHSQERYLPAPMIGIVTIVVFVFVAAMAIVAYKHCNNPFRRATHNYVMRVVTDPDQLSQSINGPEIKLNLYENPIFNSKSAKKIIEKQSLIENMES